MGLSPRLALLVTAAAITWVSAGCGRDARLADQRLREVTPGPVTAYGMTLDKSSSPQDVVYVLLKAVVADYDARQDTAAREKARDVEFAVCAQQHIFDDAQMRGIVSERERKEFLYRVVNHWAPVLGHYRESFRVDFDSIKPRMKLETSREHPDEAQVLLNVTPPDPAAEPNADAVARFRLVSESGYWRIWWVGWEPGVRDWRMTSTRDHAD